MMDLTDEAFARVRLLTGESALAAFARSRVAVIGVGGVGGWCAEALVRSGVGHLLIVDDDVVVPSNLNRQLSATRPAFGAFKVDVLAERFRSINPQARIEARVARYTPQTADAYDLGSYDAVVDAIDAVACKAHLIAAAAALPHTAFVSSMGAAARCDLSRIRVTSFSRVSGDGLARAVRQHFKRAGEKPPSFSCVWSDEPPCNRGERIARDGSANGSWMPVTAAFGLHLASWVLGRLASGETQK